MGQEQRNSPGFLRRQGEMLWFWAETEEDRLAGRLMIQRAARYGDPDALYFMGMLLWGEDPESFSLRPGTPWIRMLWRAACTGNAWARQDLDRICALRCPGSGTKTGPLTDHRGEPLEIRCNGSLMPIKAELHYENGENILTVSANIAFFYTLEPENRVQFEAAVLAGIRAWEGEYTVFGGQKLRLRMELTTRQKLLGSIIVMPMAEDVRADTRALAEKILPEGKQKKALSILDHRRSFAVAGLKWTLRSPKFIVIQDGNGSFADSDAIRDVAKHEFGHALGLGDLYPSRSDGYPGVPFGTHPALDGYSIQNGYYNLVMCDHRGPISGKDMEMVLLALREGKMQLYQKVKKKDQVSEALIPQT